MCRPTIDQIWYQGDIANAAEILHNRHTAFAAMHDYDSVRVMHAWLRALVAVAGPGRGNSAKRAAAAMPAEPKSWGRHLPCIINYALAVAAGDPLGASRAESEGVAGLAAQGLLGYAGGLRWLAADATEDAEAAQGVAREWRAAGVVAPERWRRLFAPARDLGRRQEHSERLGRGAPPAVSTAELGAPPSRP